MECGGAVATACPWSVAMRSQPLDAGVDSAKLGEAETTTEYAYVSVLFISRYEGTALYRNRSECATEASI